MGLSSAKIFTRSKAHEYVAIIARNGCEKPSVEFFMGDSRAKNSGMDIILKVNAKSNRK
jgi:hypothetical protein